MGISVALDGKLITQIATNKGWADFRKWVNTLEYYPDLKHLVEYGWSEDLEKVEEQLNDAGKTNTPHPTVASVAKELLDHIKEREEGQTVMTITDGFSTADAGGETMAGNMDDEEEDEDENEEEEDNEEDEQTEEDENEEGPEEEPEEDESEPVAKKPTPKPTPKRKSPPKK